MARGPRRALPQRRTTARRGTNWSRFITFAPVFVGFGQKVFVTFFQLSNPGITETVVRTLGQFFVTSDQAIAVEEQIGAWGMVRITDAALAIGVTAMPGPVTDLDDEGWMVWQGFSQNGQLTTGGPSGFMYSFESKAARRIEEGHSMAIVVENAHASEGFRFSLTLSLISVNNT